MRNLNKNNKSISVYYRTININRQLNIVTMLVGDTANNFTSYKVESTIVTSSVFLIYD